MKTFYLVLWLWSVSLLPISFGSYTEIRIGRGTFASFKVLKNCKAMFKQLDSSPSDPNLFKELLDTMILYNIAPREIGITDEYFMRLMRKYPGPLTI